MDPAPITIAAGAALTVLAIVARSRDGYGRPAHHPPRTRINPTGLSGPRRVGLALAGIAIFLAVYAGLPWVAGILLGPAWAP